MLNLDDIRSYCLKKPFSSEDMPFGPDTLVFRVMGKMFALTGIGSPELSINLKCDPGYALELRERYAEIIPGYHMNKKQWNTVYVNGSVPDRLVLELIDHSFELVLAKLPRRDRAQFENQ